LSLPAPEADTFIGWDNAGAKLINRAGTGTDPNALHVEGDNAADEFSKAASTDIKKDDRILFEDSAGASWVKAYDTVEGIIDLGVKTTPSDTVGNLDTKFEAPTGRGIDINTVANKIQITQLHATGVVPPGTGQGDITPPYEGAIYVDTVLNEVWIAAGTDDPADWKKSATASNNTLALLSDTTIDTPNLKNGQKLVYNGTKWVNQPITTALPGDVKTGYFVTDGEYSATDIYINPDGIIDNVYKVNWGTLDRWLVTFKAGTFANQEIFCDVDSTAGGLEAVFKDGSNAIVMRDRNEGGSRLWSCLHQGRG
jgi:hypothetical protein